MTRFRKKPLTPQQQLDHLVERGLEVRDPVRALRLLEVTSYFRLIPYMRPFQVQGEAGRAFEDGAQLNQIVTLYEFDSKLRQHVMAGIERIEVAVRAAIDNHMAPAHGAHWYMDRACFNDYYDQDRLTHDLAAQLDRERTKFERERRRIEASRARREIKQERIESRKRDNYPRFYAETYSDPPLPPSWAMVEEQSLGGISHLFVGLARDADRKAIARRFNIHGPVLGSWLHTLTFVRNICAHHARLWNRELAIPPRWDHRLEFPEGAGPNQVPRRIYTVAAILVYLTAQVSPNTGWLESLVQLIETHTDIPREPMGFPPGWREQLRNYQQQHQE